MATSSKPENYKGLKWEVESVVDGRWTFMHYARTKTISTPFPTGMSMVRSGAKFTAKWSKPDGEKIADQSGCWLVRTRDGNERAVMKNVQLTKSSTASSYTLPLAQYFPANGESMTKANTIDAVIFELTNESKGNVRVRTAHNTHEGSIYNEYRIDHYTESKSKRYTFSITAPSKPTHKSVKNGTTLTYQIEGTDHDHGWLTQVRHKRAYCATTTKNPTLSFHSKSGRSDSHQYADSLNPATPHKFVAEAWTAGPGGTSGHIEHTRYVGEPGKAKGIKIHKDAAGSYDVSWEYSTQNGKFPVDSFDIQYCDKAYHENYAEADWNTAKSGISAETRRDHTTLLGGVDKGKKRAFRICAWHDGLPTYSAPADYVDWGTPNPVTNVQLNLEDADSAHATITFTWPQGCTTADGAYIYLEPEYAPEDHHALAFIRYDGNATASYTTTKTFKRSKVHRAAVKFLVSAKKDNERQAPLAWSNSTEAIRLGIKSLIAEAYGDTKAETREVKLVFEHYNNATGADGVTVAWSDCKEAFLSNTPPEMAEFDRSVLKDPDNVDHVIIRGLERGVRYWFWARKWSKNGETVENGPWRRCTFKFKNLPGEEPEEDPTPLDIQITSVSISLARSWVKLTSKPCVRVGWEATGENGEEVELLKTVIKAYPSGGPYTEEACRKTWTFKGNVRSRGPYLINFNGAPLAEGESLDFVATCYNNREPCSSLQTVGSVTTGYETLHIARTPTATLAIAPAFAEKFSTETHTPTEEEQAEGAAAWTERLLVESRPRFKCTGSEGADLELRIRSQQNYSVETPNGEKFVYEDEVIWSANVTDDDGIIDVSGITFLDGGIYVAELIATDRISELRSTVTDASKIVFRVDWARKAIAPTADVEVNEDELSVAITPHAPAGYGGSLCDIYRVTPSGAELVCEEAAWDETYIDKYAPYNWNGCAVRVATRTAYKSVAWEDFIYDLEHDALRLNWPGGHVELPWNFKMKDSRKKNFDVTNFAGGQRRAFIEPAVDRVGNIVTELLIDEDEEQILALEKLSLYAGTVMVRTTEGHAYAAVLDVDMEWASDNESVVVTIQPNPVDANGDYAAIPLGGE